MPTAARGPRHPGESGSGRFEVSVRQAAARSVLGLTDQAPGFGSGSVSTATSTDENKENNVPNSARRGTGRVQKARGKSKDSARSGMPTAGTRQAYPDAAEEERQGATSERRRNIRDSLSELLASSSSRSSMGCVMQEGGQAGMISFECQVLLRVVA